MSKRKTKFVSRYRALRAAGEAVEASARKALHEVFGPEAVLVQQPAAEPACASCLWVARMGAREVLGRSAIEAAETLATVL